MNGHRPTFGEIYEQEVKTYNDLTRQGLTVLGVFLYGAQNYQIDTENSDIDTKAIVIPSLEDLCRDKKWISRVHIDEETGSHCDVKDIRLMFDCFKKQNINFLEILFTKYYLINPYFKKIWSKVVDKREEIAFYNPRRALEAMYGDMKSKYHNLFKDSPHSHEDIERYGYCLKEWHHINRLDEFIHRYAYSWWKIEEKDETYAEILIPRDKSRLIKMKTQSNPLERIQRESEVVMDHVESFMNTVRAMILPEYKNPEIEEFLSDIQYQGIKASLIDEVLQK